MVTTLLKLATWIKSPQLYQLSYQPKHLKTLGKGRTTEVLSEPIVPVVYPTGASMSSTPPRVSWEWPPPGAEMDPDHHHGGAE